MIVLASALAAPTSALAAPPGYPARLLDKDAAVRLEALEELAALPRDRLLEHARALRARIRKLVKKDAAPRVRGVAALVLALVEGEAALDLLGDRLERERDPLTEQMLRAAFAVLPPEPARKVLARAAFDETDPRRAALAAEALGWLPGATGLDDLLAVVTGGRHWAVVSGACLGLGRQRDARVPGELVRRLRHPDACVRASAHESLARLTGLDHGVDPAQWEEWWEQVAEGYVFPDDEAARPGPEGQAPDGDRPGRDGKTTDRAPRPGRPTFARFFGIEVTGRRVAFVIDYSQSMWGPRRAKAERELLAGVKGLPSDHTFAVVLFNGKVWWHKPGPVPARPQEKLDLALYLVEQETKNYTNIYDALDQALGLMGLGSEPHEPAPGLDELLLLSDGEPNRGKLRRPAQIVAAIEAMAAGALPIHTVSLLDEKSALLEDLARVTGGRHVWDPVPK